MTIIDIFQIFAETVELGIALLEGGNQEIQKSIFKQLTGLTDASVGQSFFKVFYETMIEAQAEIKSTVTVNTSDIAAKAQEDIPGIYYTTCISTGVLGNWKTQGYLPTLVDTILWENISTFNTVLW